MSTAAPRLRRVRDVGDLYIPKFEVKIRGRPPGRDVIADITQATFKDQIGDIDSFELTVNNWDADELRFKYTDEPVFDPGQDVELWMGYHTSGRSGGCSRGRSPACGRRSRPAASQP